MSFQSSPQGLRLPFEVGGQGLETCRNEVEDVRQSIALILTTRPGTLPLHPGFGCRLHELVFRPDNATTRQLAVFFVEQAIAAWEPRVGFLDVTFVENDDASPAANWQLALRVSFRLKSQDRVDSGAAATTLNVTVNESQTVYLN